MRKSQTSMPEMHAFLQGRGKKERRKQKQERDSLAEMGGPGLWRAKDLEETQGVGRPGGFQEEGWAWQCDFAYRMVVYDTNPSCNSHSLLKSVVFTDALCGLVFFSLAGDGGGSGEDGAARGHLKDGTQSGTGATLGEIGVQS